MAPGAAADVDMLAQGERRVAAPAPKAASGKAAVDYAIAVGKLKSAQSTGSSVKAAAGKTFVSIDGVWIDRDVQPTAVPSKIKYLSEAYFALVNHDARTRSILALGESVVWRTATGKTIAIATEGKETLTAAEAVDLLGR